jgi:hypothetical protein
LKSAVENHGLLAFDPEDIPGLEEAYKKGYLHATADTEDSDGRNWYTFSSLLHHR